MCKLAAMLGLALALLVPPEVRALPALDAEAVAAMIPPKVDGKPAVAALGIYVEEIPDINEGANAFEAVGYLDLSWTDARLKFDPGTTGVAVKTYVEDEAAAALKTIWWPDIGFANAIGKRETSNQELLIHHDGRVDYRERFRVKLQTNFVMRKFPFDSQQLVIEMEAFAWTSDDLQLVSRPGIVGFAPQFAVPGWTVRGVTESVRAFREPRDRSAFSELVAVITVDRNPGFMLWKFIIPLTIVMLLIAGVLWIPADQLKDRVASTLTGILTSAAYGFTITRYLPEHVYDTFLDAIILLSLVYSSALMIVHIVVFANRDRPALALRIDRVSRVAFPLGFVAALGAIWLAYVA